MAGQTWEQRHDPLLSIGILGAEHLIEDDKGRPDPAALVDQLTDRQAQTEISEVFFAA